LNGLLYPFVTNVCFDEENQEVLLRALQEYYNFISSKKLEYAFE